MTESDAIVWIPAYIGIGSNLNDPMANVRKAFAALDAVERTRLVATSGIYRTAPWGPIEQPDFFNAVAGVLTQLEPLVLLRSLKALETQLGRVSTVRWGPRQIDFDILVYGDLVLSSTELTLPHPGLLQRSFALVPLADVAPDLQIPGSGRVATLAGQCNRADIEWVSHGFAA